jgi:GNAT superfamily N-acetyltransferase
MVFRKANYNDIDRIYEIIKQAQEYFRENGIDQWQNNYPNPEIIEKDISNGECYVLEKENLIVATVVLSFNAEKSYERIYDGSWISDRRYAVIHRIAVDNRLKGKRLSSVILKHLEDLCLDRKVYCLRVDTHQDNKSMIKMLSNNGFIYCGIIYLESGAKRIAFEKLL